MTDDLKELAEAAKAAHAGEDLGAFSEAWAAWERAATPDAFLNLIRERDAARAEAARFSDGFTAATANRDEAVRRRAAAEAALYTAREGVVKVGIAASQALDDIDAYHKSIRPEQPRIPQSVTSALYAAYQVAHKAKREAATLTKEPTDV